MGTCLACPEACFPSTQQLTMAPLSRLDSPGRRALCESAPTPLVGSWQTPPLLPSELC